MMRDFGIFTTLLLLSVVCWLLCGCTMPVQGQGVPSNGTNLTWPLAITVNAGNSGGGQANPGNVDAGHGVNTGQTGTATGGAQPSTTSTPITVTPPSTTPRPPEPVIAGASGSMSDNAVDNQGRLCRTLPRPVALAGG